MNEHLKNLNQSYVFAYIVNYQPIPGTDTGVMTIVDNSDNNVESLLSKYGFYIDDVFISGGYGFRTKGDLDAAKDIVDNFDAIQENINNRLNNLSNSHTVFAFKGTVRSEIDNQEINLNVLYPTYNSYNFITSYYYFKVTEENVLNSLDYKYTLSINKQDNIRYIKNILIESNNDEEDIIEIDNINTNVDKYKVKLTISQKVSDNILQYNDNVNLYLYSKISEEYKNSKIEYLTPSTERTETIVLDYEFNKPNNSFDDDLVLELRAAGEHEGEENVIYSYIIPHFLRWQDKLLQYPIEGYNVNDNYNIYNFRNSEVDLTNTSSDYYTKYSQLLSNVQTNGIPMNIDTNNEIELSFESNKPSYDYIILRNNYTIAFYFNGLKSNNWQQKSIRIGSKDYYIWQSPQQYIGRHIWKIKLNI